jgi:hypothetical protein
VGRELARARGASKLAAHDEEAPATRSSPRRSSRVLFAPRPSHFYEGFFSARVIIGLFADNAFLGIAALGMTLVIFSGGIDLSVGAVIGFTSILHRDADRKHQMAPGLVRGAAARGRTRRGHGHADLCSGCRRF